MGRETLEKWKAYLARAEKLKQTPLSADIEDKLLSGEVNVSLPEKRKVVRLFTSSTFTDTEVERNYLMKEVYPYLKLLCRILKYEFEIVDMRWGVRAEASDDHETSDLCMSELFKCLTYSMGPAFISFLGNKYGYRPFPIRVPKPEMDTIWNTIKEKEITAFLEAITDLPVMRKTILQRELFACKDMASLWECIKAKAKIPNASEIITNNRVLLLPYWFRLDTNQVPPIYSLRSKKGEKSWWPMFETMQLNLREGAKALSKGAQIKYIISVTEEEVHNGILNNPNRDKQALSFRREIEGVRHSESAKKGLFIDKLGNKVDDEAVDLLYQLKDTKVPNKLSKDRIWDLQVEGQECGLDDDQGKRGPYLQNFGDLFCEILTKEIMGAFEATKISPNAIFDEVWEHYLYRKSNQASYVDRPEISSPITKFITTDFPRSPLVVYGASGSGKSSLIARIAMIAKDISKHSVVIYRFCGVTSDSSTARNLLESVIQQIRKVYNVTDDVPADFSNMVKYFPTLLPKIPETKPLILILDSLDQLIEDGSGVRWIPFDLPNTVNVKIIISILPYLLPSICSFHPFPKEDPRFFVEVPVLGMQNGEQIAKHFLSAKNRQLIPAQQKYLMEDNFKSVPTPLYLRIACDFALKWRSFTAMDQCVLAPSMNAIINLVFENLERKHGKILVSYAFGYISASRQGLSAAELEDLLSCTEEVLHDVYEWWTPPVRRLPPLLWVRIRSDTGSYLAERGSGGVNVYGWYHRQFIETARERYLNIPPLTANSTFKTQEEYLHKNMGNYFAGAWSSPHEKEYNDKKTGALMKADRVIAPQPNEFSQGNFNLRKLIELPYHLTKSHEQQPEGFYSQTLFNIDFITAKCEAGMLNDLYRDYMEAIAANTAYTDQLKDFFEFLLRSAYKLKTMPHLVRQIAVNQPSNLFVTQVARQSIPADFKYLEWLDKPQALDHLQIKLNISSVFASHFVDNQTKILSNSRINKKCYVNDATTGAEIVTMDSNQMWLNPQGNFMVLFDDVFTLWHEHNLVPITKFPAKDSIFAQYSQDGSHVLLYGKHFYLYSESGTLIWESPWQKVRKCCVEVKFQFPDDDSEGSGSESEEEGKDGGDAKGEESESESEEEEQQQEEPDEDENDPMNLIRFATFVIADNTLFVCAESPSFSYWFRKELSTDAPITGKKRQEVLLERRPNSNLVFAYTDVMSEKTELYAFDLLTGEKVLEKKFEILFQTIPRPTTEDSRVQPCVFNQDGSKFALLGDKLLRIVSADSFEVLEEIPEGASAAVFDKEYMLYKNKFDVRFYDLTNHKLVASFRSDAPFLDISSDRTRMLAYGAYTYLYIYAFPPPFVINKSSNINLEVKCVDFSPDGAVIVMSSQQRGKIKVEESQGVTQQVFSFTKASNFRFSSDSALVAVQCEKDKTLGVFNAKTQAKVCLIQLENPEFSFDFVPKSHDIMVCMKQNSMICFDGNTGNKIATIDKRIPAPYLNYTPDGEKLFATCPLKVMIFDKHMNEIGVLEHQWPKTLEFAHKYIMSGSGRGIHIWDYNSHKLLDKVRYAVKGGWLSPTVVWMVSEDDCLYIAEMVDDKLKQLGFVQLPSGILVRNVLRMNNKLLAVSGNGGFLHFELKNIL